MPEFCLDSLIYTQKTTATMRTQFTDLQSSFNSYLFNDIIVLIIGNPNSSCEDYGLCPIQDIEVVVDWFGAVMWNSPIGCIGESACPAESVDQKVCCSETFVYK